VTITGLHCVTASKDDPFDRDGKADEVYAAAYVRRYDRRSGEFLEQGLHQTRVYGDTRNFPDRIQAGSMSPTGGINDADSIPPNVTADRCCTPSDSMFPLKLWEGPLSDGADVLVITPSIWEYDGDSSVYSVWVQTQNALGESLLSRQEVQNRINDKLFGPVTVGAVQGNSGNATDAAAKTAASVILGGLGVPLLGVPVQTFAGGGKDRPYGLVPNGTDATALPNTTIVLTREIIEAALAQPVYQPIFRAGYVTIVIPKPGIMVFNFEDKFTSNALLSGLGMSVTRGTFTMVLQVERR